MCGRFTYKFTWKQIHRLAGLTNTPDGEEPLIKECFNVAPTMQAPVVRHHKDGTRTLDMLTWGLVPFFSKEPVLGKMINARSEEAAIKPSFRAAYQKRRCLVPASGFYEWRAIEGSTRKQPYYFQARSGEPFFFAGLWEFWKPREGAEETAPRKKQQSEDGSLTTFTILTGKPNELVAPVHDRMPVIVRPELYDLWLDPATADAAALSPVLEPFPAAEMEAYPVGTRVNSPKNDDAGLIEKCEASPS